MQARSQQSSVQIEPELEGEAVNDGGSLGIPLDRRPKLADERRVGLPVDVLGGIEGRKAPYFSFSLILDRSPPSPDAVSASANSSAVL